MCALCTTFSFANTCSFILHSHSFLTQLAKAGAQDMQVSCCCCCVTLVVSNSVQPHRRQPTRLPVPGILQARTLEWVAISFSHA